MKIAPSCSYPRLVGGCADGFLTINSANWAELAKTYQQMVTTAALAGDLLATYDGRKPPSIKRLVAAGANSCVRSRAVLHASDKVSQELFTEVSAKNAASKSFTTQRRFSQRPVRVASDLRDDVARRHDPAVEPDLMRTRSRVDFGARRACKPWSAERRLIDL